MEDFGYVKIKLDSLIKEKGISRNKLAYRAELQRTQLNYYLNAEITRVDLNVLSRLCNALDCEVSDILEYVPAENKMK